MKKNQFFDDLKEGLNAAIDHRDGKIDLKTTSFVLPEAPPELSKRQIKEIREETLHVSQPIFASFLGVTPAAVKAWEQGTKKPSGTARRLMQIITQDPQLIGRVAGHVRAKAKRKRA
jgi:putative transcriptional regulator